MDLSGSFGEGLDLFIKSMIVAFTNHTNEPYWILTLVSEADTSISSIHSDLLWEKSELLEQSCKSAQLLKTQAS